LTKASANPASANSCRFYLSLPGRKLSAKWNNTNMEQRITEQKVILNPLSEMSRPFLEDIPKSYWKD
jgi:hypothetical protein